MGGQSQNSDPHGGHRPVCVCPHPHPPRHYFSRRSHSDLREYHGPGGSVLMSKESHYMDTHHTLPHYHGTVFCEQMWICRKKNADWKKYDCVSACQEFHPARYLDESDFVTQVSLTENKVGMPSPVSGVTFHFIE